MKKITAESRITLLYSFRVTCTEERGFLPLKACMVVQNSGEMAASIHSLEFILWFSLPVGSEASSREYCSIKLTAIANRYTISIFYFDLCWILQDLYSILFLSRLQKRMCWLLRVCCARKKFTRSSSQMCVRFPFRMTWRLLLQIGKSVSQCVSPLSRAAEWWAVKCWHQVTA